MVDIAADGDHEDDRQEEKEKGRTVAGTTALRGNVPSGWLGRNGARDLTGNRRKGIIRRHRGSKKGILWEGAVLRKARLITDEGTIWVRKQRLIEKP